MSFDHKPVNSNHGGISRSGHTSGFHHTYRHPSDPWMPAWAWAVLGLAFAAAFIAFLPELGA